MHPSTWSPSPRPLAAPSPLLPLLPKISFANAAATPRLICASHAPSAHSTFKPLQPELRIGVAAAARLHHALRLGAGGYVQRFLRIDMHGHALAPRGTAGESVLVAGNSIAATK